MIDIVFLPFAFALVSMKLNSAVERGSASLPPRTLQKVYKMDICLDWQFSRIFFFLVYKKYIILYCYIF